MEWKKPAVAPNATNLPNSADFDQLEFKRGGDENINITINLVRDETPERFQLSPALADILDTNEATRAEAVMGIWEYIKAMGLQEEDEKRSFDCDDRLKAVIMLSKTWIIFISNNDRYFNVKRATYLTSRMLLFLTSHLSQLSSCLTLSVSTQSSTRIPNRRSTMSELLWMILSRRHSLTS